MAVKITKRGIAGKDLNTSWNNGNITSGITKNIFRWGSYGIDEGNDEVGLVPFAYVHWGNGSAGNSTINRRWNVSSISQISTGRWYVNFDTDWNLSNPSSEYDRIVPFVNGQRYNSGTSQTTIANHFVADSTGISNSYFQVNMREVGTAAVHRNTTYAWAVVLGPGKYENVAGTGNAIIGTRGISKTYGATGNSRMQPSAYARFDTTTLGSSGGLSQASAFGTTSISKFAIGRYTWNYSIAQSFLDNTPYPMVLTLGHRAGTTTPIKVSIPSNTTYNEGGTTLRNHNTNNTQLDAIAHLVAY